MDRRAQMSEKDPAGVRSGRIPAFLFWFLGSVKVNIAQVHGATMVYYSSSIYESDYEASPRCWNDE